MTVASHYVWAALFAAAGLIKGYSIVYEKYRLRRFVAGACIWLWIVMTVFFAFGNYRSHLVPACLSFAFQSFFSWHRMKASKTN
jgi:hypothetical protein